jgi:hypothetical protein
MFTLLLIILLIYLFNRKRETFASKEEKANKIYNWFTTTRTPTYIKYRKAMDRKSNIVEYDEIMKLAYQNNLDVNSIINVL